jgi:mono/diheme cytochrome c family protein
MDSQPKYKAQSEGDFFADGSAMRFPAEGTVARGQLREDDAYFRGRDDNGRFLRKAPVPLSESGLRRGRVRFDIYCSVCHGRVGDGRSVMVERGYIPPPSFHVDRIRQMDDGEIFEVMTNGIRNMPSYRNQIPARDRWQIIHYLRALQRSQNATIDDIPEPLSENLK